MKNWLVAVLLVLAAAARADEPVRFLIESISIEGARYSSPRILIAESRLTEGRSYSEAELRDAMSRIKRLPFVLHTDFRLAKGTERGRYVLVIAIEETKPLFVRIDSLHEALQTQELDQPFDPFHPTFRNTVRHFANDYYTLGARWFAGAKGVVTIATDRSECHIHGLCGTRPPGYSLGYTQYDIFGSRASIAAVVQYREQSYVLPDFIPANGRRTLSFNDHLTWQLTAAVPLFGNNAARATVSRQIEIVAGANRAHFDQGELAWLYDTTDDPLFPTRGTFVQAALESRRLLRYLPVAAPGEIPETTNPWRHDFDGRATKYWQLTNSQSIATGAELQSFFGNTYTENTLHAGYAAMLIPRTPALKYGDLRFELTYDRIILHLHSPSSHDTSSRGEGRAGIAYRNAWGVAHLTFEYLGWRHTP